MTTKPRPSVPEVHAPRRVVAIFRTREGFEREEMVVFGMRVYRFPVQGMTISLFGPRHLEPLRDVGFKVVDFCWTGRKDAYGRQVYEER